MVCGSIKVMNWERTNWRSGVVEYGLIAVNRNLERQAATKVEKSILPWRPSAAEPQPKDEKIFNHKERKDHKKEWRAGFPSRLG
jgi:hypothetical protein